MIVTKFQFLHNLDYSVRCIRSRGIVSRLLLLLLRYPFDCISWAETHFFRELFFPSFSIFHAQIWWRLSKRKRHSSPVAAHDNDVEDGHVPPHGCVMELVQSAAQAIHIEWRTQKRCVRCGLRAPNADANTSPSTPSRFFWLKMSSTLKEISLCCRWSYMVDCWVFTIDVIYPTIS